MTTTAQTERQPISSFEDAGGRALAGFAAIADANRRIAEQLINLGASLASQQLKTASELEACAVDAARRAIPATTPLEAFEEFRQDPYAWYRNSALRAADGAGHLLQLFESSARITLRDAERVQQSIAQAGKEIEGVVDDCASRLRELCSSKT